LNSNTYPTESVLSEKDEQQYQFTIPQVSSIEKITYEGSEVSNFYPKTKYVFELTRTPDYIEFTRCIRKEYL
jgi:hypothetical protein